MTKRKIVENECGKKKLKKEKPEIVSRHRHHP
jgi:hypothetical protein